MKVDKKKKSLHKSFAVTYDLIGKKIRNETKYSFPLVWRVAYCILLAPSHFRMFAIRHFTALTHCTAFFRLNSVRNLFR